MQRQGFKTGDVIFRKGDVADRLYYIVSGGFLVAELGVSLGGGAFVGELGLLAETKRRGQTLTCTARGEALSISYEHVIALYFQDPDFGYHFLRLATGRLFTNIATLDARILDLQTQLAEARAATRPIQPS